MFVGSNLDGPTAPDAALAYCNRCVVRSPCRDDARSRGEWGVWGGETDDGRARSLNLQPRRRPLPPLPG
jgi:hypothetical protein